MKPIKNLKSNYKDTKQLWEAARWKKQKKKRKQIMIFSINKISKKHFMLRLVDLLYLGPLNLLA